LVDSGLIVDIFGTVIRRYLGDVRPAATMIVAGLSDPRMRIEIEVTAKKN
jgi:enamine deaminase RidA (YjgF/YER057c/UK114 family)